MCYGMCPFEDYNGECERASCIMAEEGYDNADASWIERYFDEREDESGEEEE